ncbi:MAG: hypothetical protein RIC14_15295 [Filomicrobium sp.]
MASRRELIQAIDLALSGRWDEAHKIVQKHENDANANHIHAILHRQEGDKDNAMYWYRQAGFSEWPNTDPDGQLLRLRDKLNHQY